MKRLLKTSSVLLVSLLLIFQSCKKEGNKLELKGKVQNDTEGMIYLMTRKDGKFINLDSIQLAEGAFTFKTTCDLTELFYLKIQGFDNLYQVLAQPGTIEVTLNTTEPFDIVVKGSEAHALLEKYFALTESFEVKNDELKQLMIQSSITQDTILQDSINRVIEQNDIERLKQGIEFVTLNSSSPASTFITVKYLSYELEPSQMEQIIGTIPEEFHKMAYFVDLQKRYEVLKTVAIGQTAPVFSQADTTGAEVSLSDFKGKYVLIDFWASWCPYCREANPHLVKVFETYKDKEFVIIGISLDSKRENWIKAIYDDKLAGWYHLSDLKGWQNAVAELYGIKSIPQNVLIDPNGVIIGRNLKGGILDKKMEELFNAPA